MIRPSYWRKDRLSSHKRFDVGWKMSNHEVPLIEPANFFGGKVMSDCSNGVFG